MSAWLGRLEPAGGVADTGVRGRLGCGAAHVLGQARLGLRRRSVMSSLDSRCASVAEVPFGPEVLGGPIKPSVANALLAIVVVAIGIAIAAGAIYVGDTDDAPGASLVGILLM